MILSHHQRLQRDSIRANRVRHECRDAKNSNNELMTAQ